MSYPCLALTKWACFSKNKKFFAIPYCLSDYKKTIKLLMDGRIINLNGLTDEEFFVNNIMLENVKVINGDDAFDYITGACRLGELPQEWQDRADVEDKYYSISLDNKCWLTGNAIKNIDELEFFARKIAKSHQKDVCFDKKICKINRKIEKLQEK